MNGFIRHNNNKGFSLIEIIVAIAIIAIFATVLVPNLTRRTARQEREAFIRDFNALLQDAWQQAQISNKVMRVSVDMGKNLIALAMLTGQKDPRGEPIAAPLKGVGFIPTLAFPANLSIKNFYVEDFDEMGRSMGKKTEEVWFYIMPQGFTQSVIINMVDTKDMESESRAPHIGLVLNPFSAQFNVYDTFQKP